MTTHQFEYLQITPAVEESSIDAALTHSVAIRFSAGERLGEESLVTEPTAQTELRHREQATPRRPAVRGQARTRLGGASVLPRSWEMSLFSR